MSKPVTQVNTDNEINTGIQLKTPVTARYAPVGASARPNPSTKCESDVNRFVRLYPSITSKAMGER